MGVDLKAFVDQLKEYYKKDEDVKPYIDKLIIEGSDKFSIIKNIPDIDIKPGKKMITFLTENLIKLLYD